MLTQHGRRSEFGLTRSQGETPGQPGYFVRFGIRVLDLDEVAAFDQIRAIAEVCGVQACTGGHTRSGQLGGCLRRVQRSDSGRHGFVNPPPGVQRVLGSCENGIIGSIRSIDVVIQAFSMCVPCSK